MSYRYEDYKSQIFSEEGQVMFLKIRDHIGVLLAASGAVSMQSILNTPGVTGDTWVMMACADRLVELGEIRKVSTTIMGRNQIFVRPAE